MKSRLVIAALLAITLLLPESASAVTVKKERATAIIETLAVKGRAAKLATTVRPFLTGAIRIETDAMHVTTYCAEI